MNISIFFVFRSAVTGQLENASGSVVFPVTLQMGERQNVGLREEREEIGHGAQA